MDKASKLSHVDTDTWDNQTVSSPDNSFENSDTVLGIDLGTRYSCVGIWRNQRYEVIHDQFGNRTIPSVVSFFRSAKLVGNNALAMKDVIPGNTISDIKRIIGRKTTDPVLDQMRNLITYNIIDDQTKHHNVLIQLDTSDVSLNHKKIYRPEEICAYILIEIKRMCQNYLKAHVDKAVITVPAYFNDAQRQATLDAAKIAGLNVLKIINEPTAAALAYNIGRGSDNKSSNIIVYDLGAGTLDVSLMHVEDTLFSPIAVSGNSHLGGEDIDYLVMNYVMREFKTKHKIRNLEINKLAKLKLKNASEEAKKILSVTDKAIICVDDFYQGIKLYQHLDRNTFESICNEHLIMCIKPLNDVLESSGLKFTDIDDVILIGGSTRIPKLQELILTLFKETKIKRLSTSINPDETVSMGAAIYGYTLTHRDDPFSENLVLLDITPLSLGVETLQKQMTVIIPRNSVIPKKKTMIFSTDTDDQDSVNIKIFEGERKLTKHNFHLGTFNLSGFDKGPRGYPIIKITFYVDTNGILQVTAHEKRAGVKNTIRITSMWGAKGRMSQEEIAKLIDESESYEQIDMMYTTKLGYIHTITSMCQSILYNIKDPAFCLTKADVRKIKTIMTNTLNWLKEKEFCDLAVEELVSKSKWISNNYAPLVARVKDSNTKFQDMEKNTSHIATVHGDDNENMCDYEAVKIPNDPSEFDKNEIKELKSSIFNLGKSVLSVINNPVSRFSEEDVLSVTDYIDSVNIWLYTTNATTTIEFVAKINEINSFTDQIMEKYSDDTSSSSTKIFQEDNQFTIRDELQLTCLTLNNSIKSNYFSLKESDTDKLSKTINETMVWLVAHQTEHPDVYKEKLNSISDLCNTIYHSMHRMKVLETEVVNTVSTDPPESDSEESEEVTGTDMSVPAHNRISENIDKIIMGIPDKFTHRISTGNKHELHSSKKQHTEIPTKPLPSQIVSQPNEEDVLLKIDMTRLSKLDTFRYKNNVHHYR